MLWSARAGARQPRRGTGSALSRGAGSQAAQQSGQRRRAEATRAREAKLSSSGRGRRRKGRQTRRRASAASRDAKATRRGPPRRMLPATGGGGGAGPLPALDWAGADLLPGLSRTRQSRQVQAAAGCLDRDRAPAGTNLIAPKAGGGGGSKLRHRRRWARAAIRAGGGGGGGGKRCGLPTWATAAVRAAVRAAGAGRERCRLPTWASGRRTARTGQNGRVMGRFAARLSHVTPAPGRRPGETRRAKAEGKRAQTGSRASWGAGQRPEASRE